MKARAAAPTPKSCGEPPALHKHRRDPLATLVALIPLGTFLVGACFSWILRGRQARRELEAYRQGVLDAAPKNGCWIQTQVPPG